MGTPPAEIRVMKKTGAVTTPVLKRQSSDISSLVDDEEKKLVAVLW